MIGVLVNVGAIIIGGLLGLILHKGLPQNVKQVVMQGIGLSVIVIGLTYAVLTGNVLLLVLSLVIGGAIGALLKIEHRLDRLGQRIERKFQQEEGGFAKGFVLATLIYCVGTMAILGSLEAGVNQNYELLYIKAILDGVSAIVFTATLGYGVIFSSIPVLLYQGLIVFVGIQVEPLLTDDLIREMGAIGGVIIMGIGINILEIKHIRVGDLLPSVFVPILYFLILYLL